MTTEILDSYLKETALRLLQIDSPTGFTGEVMEYIASELGTYSKDITLLHNGNLVVTVTPEAPQEKGTLVIMAHADTLGTMVRSIDAQGRIGVSQIGGYYWESVHGENGRLKTCNGDIFTGSILYREASYHIVKDLSGKKWEEAQMFFRLDKKVKSKDEVEALGILPGDPIALDPRCEWTKEGFLKSRFLDDKAGVAVLIALIRTLATESISLPFPVIGVVTASEEMGVGGASGVPHSVRDLIAIDMGVVGKEQRSDEYSVTICAKDAGTLYHSGLRNHLQRLAIEHHIPFQVDLFKYYGSDIRAAQLSGVDARSVLIGPGVDNSHGYERTHLEALRATHDLLLRYIEHPLPPPHC